MSTLSIISPFSRKSHVLSARCRSESSKFVVTRTWNHWSSSARHRKNRNSNLPLFQQNFQKKKKITIFEIFENERLSLAWFKNREIWGFICRIRYQALQKSALFLWLLQGRQRWAMTCSTGFMKIRYSQLVVNFRNLLNIHITQMTATFRSNLASMKARINYLYFS